MPSPELRTNRGIYRVNLTSATDSTAAQHVLTLAMERADGIERVALQCSIARDLSSDSPEELTIRLIPWIERHFEETREAALKCIRAERKLFVVAFDRDHPGPFTVAA